jgi:dinuclear metal center YbgI/SA1388 family protein
MERDILAALLEQTLSPERYRDYCPNGLQVEGCMHIDRLVAGVSATQALIDAAIAQDAQAILVHHGWFWRGEDRRVVGIRKRRLQALLTHDINLFAYHLPLDGHPELGNNAQWAQRMGWSVQSRFGEHDLGFLGTPAQPQRLDALVQSLCDSLQRNPLVIGDGQRMIHRLAWCSGGAQDWFEGAIAAGADAFISGEISEHTVHLARESGVAFIAAGHHASERYGVMALAQWLSAHHGLNTQYIELDNPV